MIVSTSTAQRCDANATGVAATDWGFESLPCQVRTGLRSFTDRDGTERFYCGSLGHEANAKRRFGPGPSPCYTCRRPVTYGLFTRIDFGTQGVRNICDNCSEKADDGQYVVVPG